MQVIDTRIGGGGRHLDALQHIHRIEPDQPGHQCAEARAEVGKHPLGGGHHHRGIAQLVRFPDVVHRCLDPGDLGLEPGIGGGSAGKIDNFSPAASRARISVTMKVSE